MLYIAYDPATGAVDDIAYSRLDMIPSGKSSLPVTHEDWAAAIGKIKHVEEGVFTWSDPSPSARDYDEAMEAHLLAERTARGYTTREPSDYAESTVERWAQDAKDWIAHRDAVMLYGLSVMARYADTGEAPTLADFRANLPTITWTIDAKG